MTLVRFRLLLRRGGIVLMLLVAAGSVNVTVALAQDASPSSAPPTLVQQGGRLFDSNCAQCHGTRGVGLNQPGPAGGPSLVGVGPASVDFMLRTGRMPLDNQHDRLRRGPLTFTQAQREALVAYVASLAPGQGPVIPEVGSINDAELARGLDLFTTNCAACHGPTAAGIAVGQQDVSSSLDAATSLEIAEAVRTGPGVMPVFSGDAIGQQDMESLIAWVVNLRERDSPGGVSIGRSGPVTEGMISWLVGLGLLGIVMYLLGEKAGDDEAGDQHA